MQRDPSSLQPTAGALMSLKSDPGHICRAGSVNTRGWLWVSDRWLVFYQGLRGHQLPGGSRSILSIFTFLSHPPQTAPAPLLHLLKCHQSRRDWLETSSPLVIRFPSSSEGFATLIPGVQESFGLCGTWERGKMCVTRAGDGLKMPMGCFRLGPPMTPELPRCVPTAWFAQTPLQPGERHKIPFLNANDTCLGQ